MDQGVLETSLPVRRFCRQVLQAEPAPDFPPDELLRQDRVQQYLYEQLFSPTARGGDDDDDDQAVALPRTYYLKVLKALVVRIEASIDDWDEYGVSDSLMECLAVLRPGSALADAARKHRVVYYVSLLEATSADAVTMPTPPPTVTLLENRAVIAAAGTTGMRTWEAALHLGDYLCQHRGLICGKRVLELGAGTGYVSILCAKHLQAASVVATDGAYEVVQSLPANLAVNGLSSTGRPVDDDGDGRVCGTVLPQELAWGPSPPEGWSWGSAANGDTTDVGFDTILGADITFDARDMPDLLATIHWCLAPNRAATVLISATERNKETFDTFVRLAAEAFDVELVDFAVPQRADQAGPFYSDAVPIHVCQLHLQAGR